VDLLPVRCLLERVLRPPRRVFFDLRLRPPMTPSAVTVPVIGSSFFAIPRYSDHERVGAGAVSIYVNRLLFYSVRPAPMRDRKYVRSQPIVKTTSTKEMSRFTRDTMKSPTLSVMPPTEIVNEETPFPAAAAGARMGVMISSVRDVKNLETTLPR